MLKLWHALVDWAGFVHCKDAKNVAMSMRNMPFPVGFVDPRSEPPSRCVLFLFLFPQHANSGGCMSARQPASAPGCNPPLSSCSRGGSAGRRRYQQQKPRTRWLFARLGTAILGQSEHAWCCIGKPKMQTQPTSAPYYTFQTPERSLAGTCSPGGSTEEQLSFATLAGHARCSPPCPRQHPACTSPACCSLLASALVACDDLALGSRHARTGALQSGKAEQTCAPAGAACSCILALLQWQAQQHCTHCFAIAIRCPTEIRAAPIAGALIV